MVVPLIVFWDVDHTLIGNVSKEIYAAAFTALAGPPVYSARTGSRTGRLIIAGMFRRSRVRSRRPGSDPLAALEAAGIVHEERLSGRGHMLSGARRAGSRRREDDMVSSVLPGNIAANARVKLCAFGLDALWPARAGVHAAFGSV